MKIAVYRLWLAALQVTSLVLARLPSDLTDLEEQLAPADEAQLTTWSEGAWNWLMDHSCADPIFTTEKTCRDLARFTKDQVRIYIAEPTPEGPLTAVLPDGALTRAGAHDVVVVLDPFPGASFGHLILVFFVDLNLSETRCKAVSGVLLENGDCLQMALKNRCHNLLDKKGRRRSGGRRCEIHFLPLVHLRGVAARQSDQRLHCRSDIPGFTTCPDLRPRNETDDIMCDPLDVNTKRCDTTHEAVNTRCRLFQICDHAVLISGGWNRQLSDVQSKQNVLEFYSMLRRNGFREDNIKIFYANGIKPQSDPDTGEPRSLAMFPSVMKLALRYHIRTLCEHLHCADSLVLYMNSPARSDGASLLWDLDGNGEFDETEVYSLREMLRDLQSCAARQVVLVVDQSFSGEVVKAVVRSQQTHDNLLVFASSRDHEFSWGGEFTTHWSHFRHTHTCLAQVQQASHHAVRQSNPTFHDGSDGDIRTTLFGAPCDVTPPFSNTELEQKYLGCQNLPTRVWLSAVLSRNHHSGAHAQNRR